LQPDLTILLDSDPAMSVGRARRRNQRASHQASKHAGKHHADENRFEQQNRAFFARVHEGYLAIAAREPQRVVTVNASGTPAQTHRKIVEVVGRKLKVATKSA
jgi:dTMP kinase